MDVQLPLPPTAPLVSTQWLADHLGREQLVVLDASVATFTQPDGATGRMSGHEEYILTGHIPGAVFADVLADLSDPDGAFPLTRPDDARLAAAAGALGIDADTTVVVYDGAVGQWASRVWWLLRSAGHDRTVVLDGGYAKWRAEQRPVETGHVEPGRAAFEAAPRSGAWADKREVERVVAGEASAALVCASPRREFDGADSLRARAGHIPGSISAPAGRLVDRTTNAVLPRPALERALDGATTGGRVIVYCGAGIAATAAALALTALGHDDVAVYDGSLAEWAADPAAPLATV